MEEGGVPISAGLKRNDPFFSGGCRFGDPDCIVEGGKDCATMQVVYEITCNKCQQSVDDVSKRSREPGKQQGKNYVGMTMTSTHCRMNSHLSSQRSKSSKNPLWRHDRDEHEGQHQQYTARIMAKEKGILPLSILEALWIEKQYPQTSLNERNEFGRGSIIRISAERAIS